MESDFSCSVLSPKASISPNMRGIYGTTEAAGKIMMDLTKSINKRQSCPGDTSTAVDKELDGFKLQINRMFSKIASTSKHHPQSSS